MFTAGGLVLSASSKASAQSPTPTVPELQATGTAIQKKIDEAIKKQQDDDLRNKTQNDNLTAQAKLDTMQGNTPVPPKADRAKTAAEVEEEKRQKLIDQQVGEAQREATGTAQASQTAVQARTAAAQAPASTVVTRETSEVSSPTTVPTPASVAVIPIETPSSPPEDLGEKIKGYALITGVIGSVLTVIGGLLWWRARRGHRGAGDQLVADLEQNLQGNRDPNDPMQNPPPRRRPPTP